MSLEDLPRLVAALIAVVTPWIVVRIAWSATSRAAGASGERRERLDRPTSVARLGRITLALIPLVTAVVLVTPPSRWMFVVDGIGFAVPAWLALFALGDVEQRSRSFRISDSVRTASLRPRRAGEYLWWRWRVASTVAAGVMLAAFALRAISVTYDVRLLVPIAFACSAAVFLWLYELRIQELAQAPVVEGQGGNGDELGRRIRGTYALELTLVFAFAGGAHALLGLDWSRSGLLAAGLSLAAAVLGVVGCAVLIAAGLGERSYATADR